MKRFDNHKIEKIFSSLDKRASAFKKAVVHHLAKEFSEDINLEAEGYSAGVYQSKEGFSVKVDEVESEVEDASEYTVFLYQPMNVIAQGAPYFKALKLYQPFVKQYVPLSPDANIRLVSREVSEDEFLYIQNKNTAEHDIVEAYLRQSKEIAFRILEVSGLSPKTKVTEDLVWLTLRKEMGIRMERVPVWFPAIRSFRKGLVLKDLMASGTFDRVLIDADLSRIQVRVEKDSVDEKEYDRFQELILKI